MRSVWFCGTGKFAARCLARLASCGVSFELVVTQPPTRRGRGMKELPSPLEEKAVDLGLPVARTLRLNGDEELQSRLSACPPDVMLVVDFGQMIRRPWLDGPRAGCLNIHPSLLPKWRGAAPVRRALMNGDQTVGVAVFSLTEGMDSGPILLQEAMPLGPDDDAGTLLDKLADRGAELLASLLESFCAGGETLQPQDDREATFAPKIDKGECRLDAGESASRLACLVRALSPDIGAWFEFRGQRVKVWKAAPVEARTVPEGHMAFQGGNLLIGTSCGALRLDLVQPAGKKPLEGVSWAQGLRLEGAEIL